MNKLRFITIERLLEMKANNETFRLVDVLSEESYEKGHIPGAINIPLEKLAQQANHFLDKHDTIVVYCGSYSCQKSTKATRKLLELGYGNTFRHWKATMEYHKTKDILHVMRLLGHRSIQNTLIYTHLIDFKDEEFIGKVASTEQETCQLVEAGFEFVCDYSGSKIFRKRK